MSSLARVGHMGGEYLFGSVYPYAQIGIDARHGADPARSDCSVIRAIFLGQPLAGRDAVMSPPSLVHGIDDVPRLAYAHMVVIPRGDSARVMIKCRVWRFLMCSPIHVFLSPSFVSITSQTLPTLDRCRYLYVVLIRGVCKGICVCQGMAKCMPR